MKPKKLLKPLYISIAIVLFLSTALALTITGSTIKVIKGAQNVHYPIYFDNNESVVGFQVEVDYSTSYLTLIGIEPTSRIPEATIVYNDNSPSVRIAVLVNNETDKILPGNEAVLDLIFNVDESATLGDYSLYMSNIVVSDIEAIPIATDTINGTLSIVEPYNVTFLPPISLEENFTLQGGATLPFKFDVRNETNFIIDNSVLVNIFNESLGINHTYNTSGEGDDYITINEAAEHYIVTIHTNQLEMSLGDYDITVNFDNFQEKVIGFELIQNGIGKGKKK